MDIQKDTMLKLSMRCNLCKQAANQLSNMFSTPQELKFRRRLLDHWYDELSFFDRNNMKLHIRKYVLLINDITWEMQKLQDATERLTMIESYFQRWDDMSVKAYRIQPVCNDHDHKRF